MTSETVGKRFHLKYALVIIVLNIYMLPHLDAVILKFEYLHTNKSESSVMITIPHIFCVRAYSLKGKFYTNFYHVQLVAFLVSPSHSLIQLVKYCIAWFDVCDSFSESKYSIHIAHIITLSIVWGHNCFQLQSSYHTALHKYADEWNI
jgi:hypothetical protein